MSVAKPELKVKIDKPHDPWESHVDVIVRLPDVSGAQKIRIGPDGKIISDQIGIKGGYWYPPNK